MRLIPGVVRRAMRRPPWLLSGGSAALGAALIVVACSAPTSPEERGSAASRSPNSSAATQTASAGTAVSAAPAAAGCTSDPMAHVYNPSRLLVLNRCVSVSGTIDMVRLEADGDDHVLLHLDTGQRCAGEDCLDQANSQELGDLVVEPVCEHAVSQADAVSACSGYVNPLAVPAAGTHVTVTGPWVVDEVHGWQEIHPAESFGAAAAPAPQPATTSAPQSSGFSVAITASRYGYVAALTTTGAECSAKAVLPSGRTSTAQGLQQAQTAGATGAVSWTYRTVSTTKPGTGLHTVTCSLAGMSETASASFTVG